ncbi:tight adherence protein B [Actinomyces ruminicola]|uniref:Tight adherence protein B n=1 Tax=Actinomyces ruminicola TaxID=332524 RepID=A0A1H0B3N4_9ACTO|nr:hypothetical protein [Actinomyces ruminicola]SDN40212.1 tight adherence protein B [Actinomyces ruminicola]
MTGAQVLAGLLVALAAAVILLPARREPPDALGTHHAGGLARPARPGAEDLDLGLVLTEAATLLRAGATPQRAWARTLERAGITEGTQPDDDGVPPALLALAREPPTGWLPRRREGRWRWEPPLPGRRGRSARRRLTAAAVPGAVAACRLTTALGAPLAGVLEAVAGGVAESGQAEASRRTALSGPRATARLLALLPPVGLLLGSAVGAHPGQMLLDGGWGSALGVAGLVLMGIGHWLTARLVAAAVARPDEVDEALVLDLAGAALAAGASVPGALQALGRALGDEELGVVGRALLLGADWEEAWRAGRGEEIGAGEDMAEKTYTRPGWWRRDEKQRRHARLEACLRPGWEDGAAPAPLLAGTAASLRAGRQAADEAAAERLAVRLVLPLGTCFLPAFIILGIVPVVMSVGMDMLTG